MHKLFGATSDETHSLWLALLELSYPHCVKQQINLFSQEFLQHVQNKFSDTTKAENLDAQIYYYTEQVRRDATIFDQVAALAHMPKLLQLVDVRI